MQFTATARHPAAPSALGGQASAARYAAAAAGVGGHSGDVGGEQRRRPSPFVEALMTAIPLMLDLFMRVLGPLLVAFAWGLFLSMTYVYFWHILPMRELHPLTFPGCFYTAIGVWILINLFYNHGAAVFTSPGRLPDSLPVPANIDSLIAEEAPLIRRGEGFSKYCKTCVKPKPERAHHCHICKTCVLKMDHHCPWIANCVGHGNYKFFCLFLAYLWLGCVYLIFMCLPTLLTTVPRELRRHEGAVFFALILAVSAMIALGLMGGLHLYLILTNQTTIELYHNRRARSLAARRGEPAWLNPFDLGWRKNFQQVFGVSAFAGAWLLPGKPDVGDGVRFPRVDTDSDVGASA